MHGSLIERSSSGRRLVGHVLPADIDDPLPPDREPRRVGAVFAAVVLLVVAAAIVIPTVEAGAKLRAA